MKSEDSTQSAFSAAVSRREFIVGSTASIAVASLSRNAWADTADDETAGGISEAAFQSAQSRAAALVSQMTLEEVTAQVVNDSAAIPRLKLPSYKYWSEALHGANVDGPITSFPQPIALGCSWNPDLVHRVYTAVSDEARAFHNKTGYGLTFFSPATVNMGLRDPRWGRVNENFSEDPFLVQVLAVQTIRGMQGDDPKFLKTVACAKHYICNDTDTDRDYADAAPDRRSFWEYYTRGFEACVTQANVFTVMSAYSSLWGIPCSASHLLLSEILRDRWGFKGYVVSDCDAIADIYQTHHYVQTAPEAAAAAINAGSDLNCGNTLSRFLMRAVDAKLVAEQPIRSALTRILTGRFLLGEFDAQETVPWSSLSPDMLEGQAHCDLAREAARQSLVLLKNEGQLLPLNKAGIKKVAVIGPMAGACHLSGYSGRSTYLVSPYLGIANALGVSLYSGVVSGGDYQSTSNFRGPVVGFADDGSQFLTSITNRSWAQYGPLDFTGKTAIDFRLASILEGQIDVCLDSLNGQAILTAHIPNTGALDAWQTVSAALPATAGRHVVFLKFTATGRTNFLNLQSFQLLPAVKAKQSPERLVHAPGSTIMDPKNDALFAAAVKAAKESDVALMFVGDNRLLSDEGRDRFFLHLPDVQQDLIKAVVAANPRTVIVVNSDCPVAINWEKEHAPAVLCCFAAGEQQGNAIADALFGDYNPGGKLCSTWYSDENQLPNFHDYDIKHGRTYMYPRRDPLYPFGHGLSYTTFAYKNLKVSDAQLQPNKAITVTVDISNTGRVAGSEVVQLYVQVVQPAPPTPQPGQAGGGGRAGGAQQRPAKQLAGFQRVDLQPGESKTIALSLPHDHIALRHWDDDKQQFAYDPGNVGLLIGSSSVDIRLQSNVALV